MQIPNLGNAATSNADLYKKKKKKKNYVNRDQIPNLGNAAKSNTDLYVNKDKPKNVKKNEVKKGKKLNQRETIKQKNKERAKKLAKKRIGTGTAKKPQTTIAQLKERNKKRIQDNARDKNADWKKMKSGDMSKAAFIKKYPNSQTAKNDKKSVTTKRKVINKKRENKTFNKKHNINEKDNIFSKFAKSGGIAGWINRKGQKIRSMTSDDLRIFKKKKKK